MRRRPPVGLERRRLKRTSPLKEKKIISPPARKEILPPSKKGLHRSWKRGIRDHGRGMERGYLHRRRLPRQTR
ncbi:MAG TPA: hypothetical protein EYP89_02025 [Candidatus Omnitrophica bacterium]|nr:hypothetical protein [Candidatus Omnitrophota bacterium]